MSIAILGRIRGKIVLLGLGLAWMAFLSVAFYWVNRYQMTPGAAAAATSTWPGSTSISLAPDRATLIMFLHPQCPCSRSSLGELTNIMSRRGDRVAAYVSFFNPDAKDQSFTQTDLWTSAEAIPGVKVLTDTGGVMARQFGAVTSGQVLLYDAHGRLLFNGGITDSRGHFGDNAGEDAVMTLLDAKSPPATMPVQFAVFGCPIDTLHPLIVPALAVPKDKVCTQ